MDTATETETALQAAKRELAEHKARCRHCKAEITQCGAPLCSRRTRLAAKVRRES